MAWRNFTETKSLERALVTFDIAIPTNGATTPVASGIRGPGVTVTRTGVGTYTVVFGTGLKFNRFLNAIPTLRLAAPVADEKTLITTWVASTRTLTVQRVTASTGVALEWPAANADNELMLHCSFSNTAAVPTRG